ncbi:MAG: hypothetical protein H5T86_10605 [Armatimonadetes bacterium]|nr:hypothetical protein [Armatimonadota bacterium]
MDERAGICGLVTVAAQKGGGVYFFIDGAPAGASPPTPRTEVLVNFALAQVEKPKRILVVGGAINGALRECLKHKPEHVDCVEFDPVVLRMARKWSVDEDRLALSDPRVTTVAADPRLFLRRAQQGYDAIILTLAAPATALINRFYTVEWFRLCYQKLNPGGVVSFSLPYDQVYQDQTLAAFDRTIVTSAQSAARPRTAQTAILAGAELVVALRADGPPLAQEPDVVLRRLSQRGVEAPYLQAFVFDWADKNNLAQAHQMLNGPPECNSDARPVAYFLGTARWLAEMTPGVGALLLWTWHRIGRHGWRDFFGFFSLIGLALGLLAAAKGSRRFAAMPFMVLAGFAGMALELGVLMSLQNLHGYVYGWVGVVTGGFMLGLALGAVAALEGRVAVAARFVLAASGVVSAAAAAVCLSGRALPLVGFPGLAVLAGAFVGVAFRVALRTWTTAKPAAGVGMLYAADLLGGVAGALLIPAILIPAAGLVAGSLAPAVAALPPFIVLAWPRTR